jgi:hypothetical protein
MLAAAAIGELGESHSRRFISLWPQQPPSVIVAVRCLAAFFADPASGDRTHAVTRLLICPDIACVRRLYDGPRVVNIVVTSSLQSRVATFAADHVAYISWLFWQVFFACVSGP